jgi:tRNA A-37 threonylcarbamoyl transferase component Bud32
MVARASDPVKRPRGWTLHTLPADEVAPPETPQSGPAAVLEASTDLCGRLLGARYDVKELLSHGERGAVYLADDRNYGRVVALRLSAPQAASGTGEDVRALARRRMGVRHPHLAAVQGEGLTEGGLHYVAMEHVEGRNLLHMIGDPRLRWPAIHTIGMQVAEALVALHGAWVTHGDVHPGNMVWSEDAERSACIKLVDLDVSGRDSVGYLPPGFSGERDSSCDVYALVASLYELSTGAAPSPGFAALATQTDAAGVVRPAAAVGAAVRLGDPQRARAAGQPARGRRASACRASPMRASEHGGPGRARRRLVAHAPSGPMPMFARAVCSWVPRPVVHAPSGPVAGDVPRASVPLCAVCARAVGAGAEGARGRRAVGPRAVRRCRWPVVRTVGADGGRRRARRRRRRTSCGSPRSPSSIRCSTSRR